MPLCLSRYDFDQLLLWASDSHPQECCGLIWGSSIECNEQSDHYMYEVHGIELTKNVANDPSRYFEIDPVALINAAKDARSGHKQLIGYFHSHPNGLLTPSMHDANMADDVGMLWIIIADNEISAWLRQQDGELHNAFNGIDIEIMA